MVTTGYAICLVPSTQPEIATRTFLEEICHVLRPHPGYCQGRHTKVARCLSLHERRYLLVIHERRAAGLVFDRGRSREGSTYTLHNLFSLPEDPGPHSIAIGTYSPSQLRRVSDDISPEKWTPSSGKFG